MTMPQPSTRRNAIQSDCDCPACIGKRMQREATELRIAIATILFCVTLFITVPILHYLEVPLP